MTINKPITTEHLTKTPVIQSEMKWSEESLSRIPFFPDNNVSKTKIQGVGMQMYTKLGG